MYTGCIFHVMFVYLCLNIIGSACCTRVTKVLAKTYLTPQDAETDFHAIIGPVMPSREMPEKAPDNRMQEREPPEGVTLIYTYCTCYM